MRRLMLLFVSLFTLMIMPTNAQETDIFSSSWRGDYFNNPYLAGEPILTRFDQGIGFDWERGAPDDDLPIDNFSVRWGKGGDFPAGTYRFIVTASLGFRLYIDGDVILDTWEGGLDGVTIGRDIFIEAGYHNLQIDYRDFNADAFIYLDWGLAPNGGVAPQSSTVITDNTITVTANTLNVRSEPRIANNITTRITRGQQFTQLAESEDGRWIQIDLGNGTNGWVTATFVVASDSTLSTTGLRGQTVRSTARLLVRTAPNRDAETLGLLLRGEDATVIGRSSDGEWWQINDSGTIGWVNANFVILSQDIDADAIDITDQ